MCVIICRKMRIITTTAVAMAVLCHRQRRNHRHFDRRSSRSGGGAVLAFSSSGGERIDARLRIEIIRFHRPATTANNDDVGLLRAVLSTVDERRHRTPTRRRRKKTLLEKNNARTTVVTTLDGLITRRRAIGKHLVFLDLLPMDLPRLPLDNNNNDDNNDDDEGALYCKEQIRKKKKKVTNGNNEINLTNVIQVIMRRDLWDDNRNSSSTFDIYHKIIQPGVHVKLTGYSGPKDDDDPNVVVYYCREAKYTLANNDPRHLRNVLHYIVDGSLDIYDVIRALPYVSPEELTSTLDEAVTRRSGNDNEEVVVVVSSSDDYYLERKATTTVQAIRPRLNNLIRPVRFLHVPT